MTIYQGDIYFFQQDLDDYYWLYKIDVIPEPGSIALLATGALGFLAYVWRRRQW